MISLTGKNQISVTNTPSSSTGGPRVYRFVVTDPKLSGSLNKMKPSVTALALRPATPVHIANSTVVTTQPQPKVSPPSAVPKETTMTSKQLKSEPSSNAISHQLAQIGIDAIAAQAHVSISFVLSHQSLYLAQVTHMVIGRLQPNNFDLWLFRLLRIADRDPASPFCFSWLASLYYTCFTC